MITNQVLLLCRLTKEAELRYTPQGKAYCNATVHHWHGSKSNRTSFFDTVAFGETAERLARLEKGSKISLEGYLSQRSWEDSEGKKHYKVEICLNGFKFIEGPKAAEESAQPSLLKEDDPFTD